MTLYDMGKRITELVLRRDIAIGHLLNGPRNKYVDAAIHELLDEPAAGTPGGPARSAPDVEVAHRSASTLEPDDEAREAFHQMQPEDIPGPEPEQHAGMTGPGLNRSARRASPRNERGPRMTFPAVCPVANAYEWMDEAHTGGPMTFTRGLVLHVNEGNGDPYRWWMQPTTPIASSHFQVMKDGRLIQYVGCDTVAWCQVAGSTTWHSVETEGFSAEPLTAAQVATLGRLYAWGAAALGWRRQIADSPNGAGFGIHSMGGEAWGGHACPGIIRSNQRAAILAAATGTTGDDEVAVLPTITGSDHTHPKSLALAKTLLKTINPAANMATDAASIATVKGFQTYFRVASDGAPGRIGPNTWRALLYLATGGSK